VDGDGVVLPPGPPGGTGITTLAQSFRTSSKIRQPNWVTPMQNPISTNSLPLRAYSKFAQRADQIQSFVLLLLRLAWGWQLAESGHGHLTHIEKTVEAFKGWGVPFPVLNVYISAYTELLGGSLLLLGLATRLIAVPLVFNFIVAIVAASRHDIADAFSNKGFLAGWDAITNDGAFPFLMLALIMLSFGPGKASVDYLLQRTVFHGPPADPAPGGFPVGPAR
jgi:putative oxidoreductase